MYRVRELQDYSLEKYSIGFTSFIAWPVQLENNSYGKETVGETNSSWVRGQQSIFVTLQSQDSSLIISNIYKHHGQLWDYNNRTNGSSWWCR